MLKSLEKISMAFLGQVSSVSPLNVAFTFFSLRDSPNTGPGRLLSVGVRQCLPRTWMESF